LPSARPPAQRRWNASTGNPRTQVEPIGEARGNAHLAQRSAARLIPRREAAVRHVDFLNNGLPAPVATDITVPAGTFQAEALDFRNTRTHQYNLFVEKEFGGNVAGGGYLGWRQNHLTQYIPNIDLAPAAAGTIQPRRAFSATLPNVSSIPLIASDFEGTYNAMQLVFQCGSAVD
jgi:hypothetical protein